MEKQINKAEPGQMGWAFNDEVFNTKFCNLDVEVISCCR